MTFIRKLEGWLEKMLWHESDTPKTLEQKVYMVRNGILASVLIITLTYIPFIALGKFHLLLLASPMVLYIIIADGLLMIIKRGIKWFMHFYYGGYIVVTTLVVISLGGLPNSCAAWGGAFIVFMHALAVRDRRILGVNAGIYFFGLASIAILYPRLTVPKEWTPGINNYMFTVNEIWMCLFLVKSFYDSIVFRTNEAKKRAAHLLELDALKSKLYANITHEFRTPLTLIRGNAGEITEHKEGLTCKKANEIILSADKILFLVNQMLNLSKIEEGRVPMHYNQRDLVAFVRFVAGNFQGLADMKKIGLHFQSGVPKLLMDIEPEKLEESLSNLLSNAIKFTPEGGQVFITVRMMNTSAAKQPRVGISVRDTGIGIPADKLDKIFIRFYRVEDNGFSYQEGSGIGLTLVNEYVKLMKGTVEVTSSPGKGSEFTVTLPVTHRAELEDVADKQSLSVFKEEGITHDYGADHDLPGHPCLLIIEDNPELKEYLIRLLCNDYLVLAAENGVQGVELAAEHIPDIILSDVMMPGKDGFQVCRELKNDFRTSHIPIVLLTARADAESRIAGLSRGADAYLTKPFHKRELQICLHNLLVRREMLRLKFSTLFEHKVDEEEHGLNGQFLERVKVHLEENYRNDWYGIHHLYADLGISRVQLHRKLTALTGQPASHFIRNFRLQKAKKLLVETNKHVSDIAFEVGITDASYFTQLFTRELGLSPTELRNTFV
ncbi:MAG: ATP-binding protein [Bacteroidota bacterium]